MTRNLHLGVPILVVFLCLSVVPPVVIAGSPAQVDDTPTIEQRVIQEDLGDIVSIPLTIPNGSTATLTIAGGGFAQDIVVHDTDGDGRILVSFNTYRANNGHGVGTTTVGADSIASVRQWGTAQLQEGRHTIDLSVDGTRHDLAILELDTGKLQDATGRVAPHDNSPNRSALGQDSLARNNSVARGDVAIYEFGADGITGVGEYENPPGRNLVYPESSLPSQKTAHTVQVTPKHEVEFSTMTIKYRGEAKPNVANATLDHVGIDANGNGRIDRKLEPSDNKEIASGGDLSLVLDASATLAPDETLLVKYSNVTNPEVTGKKPVTVQLSSTAVDGGIMYGKAGYGQFGHGISVDMDISGESTVVDPMPYNYYIDQSTDRLYVFYGTATMPSVARGQSIETTLQKTAVQESDAHVEQQQSVELQVVEREATIDLSNDSIWAWEFGSTFITGRTTLAPGSLITVQFTVQSETSPRSSSYRTLVGSGGDYRVELDLSETSDVTKVQMVILSNDERISKRYILSFDS